MMWYTHVIFAALLFLVLKAPMNFPWLAFPLCLAAALMPDIDHHNSKISNKMKITSRIVNLFFNHRGIIHSLVAAIAFSVVVFVICNGIGLGIAYSYVFFLGYASHLFLDSLNPAGIAWLRPFASHRARSMITTNSLGEKAILIIISALTLINFAKLIL